MYPYAQGRSTRHAHKAIPDGCFEEEQGRGGFYGPASHLIKPAPSTRWKHIKGPLKPRMFDLLQLKSKCEHPTGEHPTGEHPFKAAPLLRSPHIVISFLNLQSDVTDSSVMGEATYRKPTLYRNADGDTLYFCHTGRGQVVTEYGVLKFEPSEYILIPKCVAHTFLIEPAKGQTAADHVLAQLLVIENRSSRFRGPDRGITGRTALYDPNALQKPCLEALHTFKRNTGLKFCDIMVKRADDLSHFEYDDCVLDAVGWKGDLWPLTLHTRDIMPLMSPRVHLPPSAHSTFVAYDFVVCTFLPRPLEEDADALKVPFYHQNIDYDEVLFYHAGDFFSRDNLHAGMMSLHPAGFPHGPHPKAVQSVANKTHTNECAVMIDSRSPLSLAPTLSSIEQAEYWRSWQG